MSKESWSEPEYVVVKGSGDWLSGSPLMTGDLVQIHFPNGDTLVKKVECEKKNSLEKTGKVTANYKARVQIDVHGATGYLYLNQPSIRVSRREN